MPDVISSSAHTADRSAAVRFRRALTLTAMTLVMPGSAQVVAGNRRVGRIAIRVWLTVLALGVAAVVVYLLSRATLLTLLTDGWVMRPLRLLLIVGAVAWAGLLIDAWRLGAPHDLRRGHRAVVAGLNGVLCIGVAATMILASQTVSAQQKLIGSVTGSGAASKAAEGEAADGRYNILLLGGDSGKGRVGLRPDSINVASVDADTGRTVLVGLPRNLQNVPFPEGTVMHEQFPDGFSCETDCYLNGVNTWANDHADLFDTKHPGMDATVEAVEETTGLDIGYYAIINMNGFANLVDALGGVTLDVKERTAIGGIGAPVTGYIKEGRRHLTGRQVTWYARSRVDNDDYSRMGRQKCIMTEMLGQLSPQKVLTKLDAIADSAESFFETSIPQGDVGTFLDLALKARGQKVSSVSIVPPQVNTSDPDFDKVRRMVQQAVAKSEGTYSSNGVRNATLSPLAKPKITVAGADPRKDPRRANQSDDLEKAC
jgi:LCP family protein required for cell wall assembly